jgi:hypothetical protein
VSFATIQAALEFVARVRAARHHAERSLACPAVLDQPRHASLQLRTPARLRTQAERTNLVVAEDGDGAAGDDEGHHVRVALKDLRGDECRAH